MRIREKDSVKAPAKYEIRKEVTSYAYPRNGNVHNPTPRVRWYVCRIADGVIVDSAARCKPLKVAWPEATVIRKKSKGP
jgi:hypothetical protein